MRICHVVDFFHTDLLYQEYHLALQQAEAGHDVHVVTTTRRQSGLSAEAPSAAAGARALDDAGVTVHRLGSRDLGHDRVLIDQLGETLASIGPDAIHCHQCFTPTTARVTRWASKHHVALLCDSHLSALNSPAATSPAGRAFYGSWRWIVGPWLRRKVGAFVVNGAPERDFLADHLGLPAEAIEIIPLGFDADRFTWDAGRRQAARARWGVADDEVAVAVTGKIVLERKTDQSIGAAERLSATRSVRVLVAGSTGDGVRETWAAAGPSLVAEGRIQELGMLPPDELADCFLASDVIIFPFGSTISAFEAFGTGLPVAVIAGGFGDYLADLGLGASAVDVPTVDLATLLVEDGVRAARAAEAISAVSWRVLAQRFVDRYAALVERGRS